MFVYIIELVLESEGKICHGCDMLEMYSIRCLISQTLTRKSDHPFNVSEKAMVPYQKLPCRWIRWT